jgi:hypothetical protein
MGITRNAMLSFRVLASGTIGFLLLIVTAIIGVVLYFPARSLLWHAAHGSQAQFCGYSVGLPLLWWRGPDGEKGTVVLRRATPNTPFTNDLELFPLDPIKIKREGQAAQEWQSSYEAAINPHLSPTIIPIELHAPAMSIYCERDITPVSLPKSIVAVGSLYCRGPGLPLGIRFSGSPSEEHEVEAILSSLRKF